MTFQAYLDTVQAKTGKTLPDFRVLAAEQGLTKHGEIVKWLKEDFGLGHGHATAVAAALLKDDPSRRPKADRVDAVFAGKKAAWRGAYDALWTAVQGFGDDVDTAPTETYVSFRRGGKKFALVQPGTAHVDVGFKRPDAYATARFAPAGSWNSMVTHRTRLTDAAQVDAELLGWLRAAYEAAK